MATTQNVKEAANKWRLDGVTNDPVESDGESEVPEVADVGAFAVLDTSVTAAKVGTSVVLGAAVRVGVAISSLSSCVFL